MTQKNSSVQKIATRQAYGDALAEFGEDKRIVVLDADLSASTRTNAFRKKYPEDFQYGNSRGKYDVGCCRTATW